MVLFQNDPLRDFDAFFDRLGGRPRSAAGSAPMDAYRRGDDVWVHIDLPGVAADSIDITIERNVLTVTATRDWVTEDGDRLYVNERHRGTVTRQVHLGDSLDGEAVEADHRDGVLTLRIPVAEKAQPRKIEVSAGSPATIDVTSSDA